MATLAEVQQQIVTQRQTLAQQRSQTQAQKAQVEATRAKIMTPAATRAITDLNKLTARKVTLGKVNVAKEKLKEQEQLIGEAESEVGQAESNLQSYLRTPEGIVQYAKESNIQPIRAIYGEVVEGGANEIIGYEYETPYGTAIDYSPRERLQQSTAKAEAYQFERDSIVGNIVGQSNIKGLDKAGINVNKLFFDANNKPQVEIRTVDYNTLELPSKNSLVVKDIPKDLKALDSSKSNGLGNITSGSDGNFILNDSKQSTNVTGGNFISRYFNRVKTQVKEGKTEYYNPQAKAFVSASPTGITGTAYLRPPTLEEKEAIESAQLRGSDLTYPATFISEKAGKAGEFIATKLGVPTVTGNLPAQELITRPALSKISTEDIANLIPYSEPGRPTISPLPSRQYTLLSPQMVGKGTAELATNIQYSLPYYGEALIAGSGFNAARTYSKLKSSGFKQEVQSLKSSKYNAEQLAQIKKQDPNLYKEALDYNKNVDKYVGSVTKQSNAALTGAAIGLVPIAGRGSKFLFARNLVPGSIVRPPALIKGLQIEGATPIEGQTSVKVISGTLTVPQTTGQFQSRAGSVISYLTKPRGELFPAKTKIINPEVNYDLSGEYFSTKIPDTTIGTTIMRREGAMTGTVYSQISKSKGNLAEVSASDLSRSENKMVNEYLKFARPDQKVIPQSELANVNINTGIFFKAGKASYTPTVSGVDKLSKVTFFTERGTNIKPSMSLSVSETKTISPFNAEFRSEGMGVNVAVPEGAKRTIFVSTTSKSGRPSGRGRKTIGLIDTIAKPSERATEPTILKAVKQEEAPQLKATIISESNPVETINVKQENVFRDLTPQEQKLSEKVTQTLSGLPIPRQNAKPEVSEYFGKGLYERTSEVAAPLSVANFQTIKDNLKLERNQPQILFTSQDFKQEKLSTNINQDQSIKAVALSLQKDLSFGDFKQEKVQNQREIQLLGEVSVLKSGQKMELESKSVMKPQSIQTPSTIFQRPTTPSKKIPNISDDEDKDKRIKKILGKLRTAYNVVTFKNKKPVIIGKGLPEGKAKKLGVAVVSSTARASFKLISSGTTNQEDINYNVSGDVFRKGKKDSNLYVQRRNLRLGSRSEVSEVMRSKRNKKSRKLSWF